MGRNITNIWALARSLVSHRDLILRLAVREFTQRFRGSALGITWAVLTPVLTAIMFTFVFTVVFKARWGSQTGVDAPNFTVILLCGMAVHALFAEVVSRAPMLVVGNPSYVTKVVFPLEVLPAVVLLSALVNAGIALGVALVGNLLLNGTFHFTALLLPLILLPYLVFLAAAIFVLAAFGVYLRDLSQLTALLVTLSLFLTPIFFPLEAVPLAFQKVIMLNPLTFIVEQTRAVVVFGQGLDFLGLGLYTLVSLAALAGSFWLFQRLRPGFADVL